MNMVGTFTGVDEGIILGHRKRGGREVSEEEGGFMGGGGLCFPRFNREKGLEKVTQFVAQDLQNQNNTESKINLLYI